MIIVPLSGKKEFIRELAELHHAEWQHLSPTLTLEGRISAIENCAEPKGIPSIYIAISEGQLLGSAALVESDMDSKPDLSPWIAAVYVKESFRRQGIASQLVRRCENEALRSNVSVLYLYTEFASQLYETLGWCLLERSEHKGVTVYVMCKQIDS